ncbi:MAG TPA: hypothetical protein VKS79_21020 [Gemmataceae bacterium]|nr:hypothetical protein [Gemmataceae bacterium]
MHPTEIAADQPDLFKQVVELSEALKRENASLREALNDMAVRHGKLLRTQDILAAALLGALKHIRASSTVPAWSLAVVKHGEAALGLLAPEPEPAQSPLRNGQQFEDADLVEE